MNFLQKQLAMSGGRTLAELHNAGVTLCRDRFKLEPVEIAPPPQPVTMAEFEADMRAARRERRRR
jgi:hypothetical protein